jgi:O-acetyl-ADP-ribose deacetylase (regulator of RNase III)
MLKYVNGNFFDFDADIRVNTVNCVGVMGKGVALAFKQHYPDMFRHYVKQCRSGEIRPGRPAVWLHNDMISKGIEIINFPTKDDWKNPSEYSYVEDGLVWLASYLRVKQGKIVTLPALGCGNGGLEWSRVKALIEKHLKDSPAEILVFEPSNSTVVKKNTRYLKQDYDTLASVDIEAIAPSSSSYPESLRRYTSKDLFLYSSRKVIPNHYFSLICSSKPSEEEQFITEALVDYLAESGVGVLLGSSAYEKKLALSKAKDGVNVACFLPSGIYDSAQKLREKGDVKNLALLSIGDPMRNFDKKEYLPSVLSRIYLAEKNIFITHRLSWLSRYENQLKKDGIKAYFIHYAEMDNEDLEAASAIGARELNLDSLELSLSH